MKMSLRARILLWYGTTMAVIIFGLAFTAQHIMLASLRADLDESLRLRADMVINAIDSSPAPAMSYYEVLKQLAEFQLPSVPLFIRIGDPLGETLARFGDIPEPITPLLDSQLRLAGTGEGQFASIKAKNTQALRVYTVGILDPSTSKPLALVQTGESLAAVAAAEDRLWRYALVEGIIGSLIALAIGSVILQRGFRPLDRILSRMQAIKDTELSAGLPTEPRPRELQRLADSLNSMWHRLDSALKAKETFVASVSHDLRTPLTAIQGQIGVLQRKASVDPEMKESLERASKEVHRLVRMTNNLLLNTQLDSSMPPVVTQDVNLRELLEEIVREVYLLGEGLNITLLAREDVVITGDYDLLKQMVLNVTDNAIKFTPRGGQVELALRTEDGWAVIEVQDSGQGIPGEHLPHIMEPFYKVRSAASLHGVGLGLAIVKQIIELHKGKVEINSQVNVGTTVKMRLPLSG
jgi:signal transduction histidine kinase